MHTARAAAISHDSAGAIDCGQMASQSKQQRQRLTAQTLERMREGIRKRAEAIGRDHERRSPTSAGWWPHNRLARGM